jgi:putative flippase GtrA
MPIGKFGWNKESLVGFVWHQGIGAVCFFFDISIIYLLLHYLHLQYPLAVAGGFTAATFLNYSLARSTIYSKTDRGHRTAIMLFFATGAFLLLVTVGGTVFLREVLGLKLYVARTVIGMFIGVVGYFIDCLITFRLR